jgi:hypothetical protein
MSRVHLMKFRVSMDQLERIRKDAALNGYVRLAPYIRDTLLKRVEMIESKVLETNQNVKRIMEMIE